MSYIFYFALVAALFSALNAQSCDVKYVNGLAPECISQKSTAPYCRLDVYTSGATTICSECLTDCDCDVGQYCSVAPETLGTCRAFSAAGRDCLPFTEAQLENSEFDASLKCADLFTVSGANASLVIDHQGTCLSGVCQYCAEFSSATKTRGFVSCVEGSGTNAPRECVWPGALIEPLEKAWQPSVYIRDRVAVWTAILFPLMVIAITVFGISAFRTK
eukprot:TRINITY_DN6890_c0_g1_i1.p1 TRINITY_DN6890_c0_g1~~TRINITY_DN6890_c0_g1_i1.p1  ORF type:complete len:218 (-),score=39.92 TRINITY_DN6890_c0_g1_i1:44-697(-)